MENSITYGIPTMGMGNVLRGLSHLFAFLGGKFRKQKQKPLKNHQCENMKCTFNLFVCSLAHSSDLTVTATVLYTCLNLISKYLIFLLVSFLPMFQGY